MNFIESDICFKFGADCFVKKFDDHKYYNILSGSGLKGVDFILINKVGKIHLIEVKNYKRRKQSPVEPDVSDIVASPFPLAQHFVEKINDSLRLIRVVNQYHKRKWWVKALLLFENFFPSSFEENQDWYFWILIEKIINNNKNDLICCLVLDMADTYLAHPTFSKDYVYKTLESEIKSKLNGLAFNLIRPINNVSEM